MDVQEKIGEARAAGYSWGEVNDHLASKTQEAINAGYSQAEIDDHLGYQDPSRLQSQLNISAARKSTEQAEQLPGLDPVTRRTYVDALIAGGTKGPQDFTTAYHGAGHAVIPNLDTMLPDHADATDHAIALTHDAGLPLISPLVQQTKANLLDRWADTGMPLSSIYGKASQDPILRNQLTQAPVPPQIHALAMNVVEKMESGGNPNAVSKAGAQGLFQVMPATARELGFDPDRLKDPAYNRAVATAVMYRNAKMFPGDTEAQLIAYNAGPGRAERWIKAGRDNSLLPAETQNYLAKYAQLTGGDKSRPYDPVEPPKQSFWQTLASQYGQWSEGPPITEEEVGAAKMALDNYAQWVASNPAYQEPTTLANSGPESQAFKVALGMAGPGAEATAAEGAAKAILPDVGGLVRRLFNVPAAEEAAPAQAVIRKATGTARQATAQAAAALEQYRKLVNAHLPEYKSYLKLSPEVRTANEDYFGKPLIANLIDFVEGRSTGATLDPKSPFAPLADAMRDIFQKTRGDIETQFPNFEHFYEDYYRHMWTDPTQADRLFGAGRMGSNASLNLRKLPTVADGLSLGLTPKILDPIDNTLHYVTGMQNYLAQQQVFQWGRDSDLIKYFKVGEEKPEGWEALNGRGATKAVAFTDEEGNAQARQMQAYAPPGLARSYNNWVGRGFNDWGGAASQIYQKIQTATNAMTAWKLGLSAYHAATMTKELIASGLAHGFGDVAQGIGKFDMGQVANGLWNVFGTAVTPIKVSQQLVRGSRLARAYLGQKDYGAFMSKLDDITHLGDGSLQQLSKLYAEAGGRVLSRGEEYSIGENKNLFKAFRNGSLVSDFQARWGDSPVGALAKTAGDVLSTISAPLFDYAIPRIKFAAWADEMQSWMRRNPTAGLDAQQAMARRLSNAMDDRFGEMVLDNIFWPRAVKQSLNAATISVGWNYGTLRMVGTGIKQIAQGNLLSPEARVLFAYPAAMALTASAYQYLKTGTLPGADQNTAALGYEPGTIWQDLVAPRTGGTVTLGGKTHHETVAERSQLPGYDKDFDSWYFDVANAPVVLGGAQNFFTNLPNKLNPTWSMAWQLARGQNYFNEPIAQHQGIVEGLEDYAKYVGQEMLPIWAGMQERRQAGSNIGLIENMLGPRTAPTNLLDPKWAKGAALGRWIQGVKQEQSYQQLQEERRETPPEPTGEQNAPPVPKPSEETFGSPAAAGEVPRPKRSHHAKRQSE